MTTGLPAGIEERMLRQGSQIIIEASGERLMNGLPGVISYLTRERGQRGVMISTLWSANALSRRIGLLKLPRNSLRIIDTVSLSMGSKVTAKDNFTLLPAPVPLESILVEIEKLLRGKGPEMNFLVIDSLTFIRNYFSPGQLGEFFHYILNRMLEEEATVLIFDQDSEDKDSTSRLLTSIMDRRIRLEKDGGGDQQ